MNEVNSIVLFQATPTTPQDAWQVEDDVVMGGKSAGKVEVSEEGHVHFFGHVSLENNGGFSSIRHTLSPAQDVAKGEAFHLRLQGDGATYTFRVKSAAGDDFYHEFSFPTTGKWETVAIPFNAMKAVHHGEPVDVPNYAGEKVNELQLLIGNGKEQSFDFVLDGVEVPC